MTLFTTILAAINGLHSSVVAYDADRGNDAAGMRTLIAGLTGAINGLGDKLGVDSCGGCGTELEPPPGAIPGDPDIDPVPTDPDFPTWENFDDYKCKVSNFWADYWEKWLFDASIRDWDALSVGVLSVIVNEIAAITVGVGVVIAGVVISSGILIVAGLVIAIAASIIGESVDFADMGTAVQIHKEDIICAMYNADTAEDAKNAVMQILIDAGLSVPEREIMGLIINNNDLNKLFEKDSQLENIDYVGSSDCACVESSGLYVAVTAGAETGFSSGDLLNLNTQYEILSTLCSVSIWNSAAIKMFCYTDPQMTVEGLFTVRIDEFVPTLPDTEIVLHTDAGTNVGHSFISLKSVPGCGEEEYGGAVPVTPVELTTCTGMVLKALCGHKFTMRFTIISVDGANPC